MSTPRFEVHPFQRAYTRKGTLAVEVLDAVTLQRLTQVRVRAQGFASPPIVNQGGLFTWRNADIATLERLFVDPRALPYEAVEIAAADVSTPLHRVALHPTPAYAFTAGVTAIRGALLETMPVPGSTPDPIPEAVVRFAWLDEDGTTWHAPPQRFRTNTRGQFAAFVPFAAADRPALDAAGEATLRLFAECAVGGQPVTERSTTFPHAPGRVSTHTYAWDQFA